MIGTLDSRSKEVTIVGAGIAGLLSAYYLEQRGWTVRLIEAQSQAGGLLGTEASPYGLVENAAHSIPASPEVVKHFQELGLKLLPLKDHSRFIYKNGKPRKMPLSIFEIFRAFCRAYLRLAPSRDPEELTFSEWARHFLGEPALKYLITPFTRGIFGAEPEEILVSAAFPELCVPRGHSLLSFMLAKKWRRTPPVAVKRKLTKIPRGPISAPENGMGSWVSALTKHLEQRLGDRFEKNKTISSIAEFVDEKNLILTVPAPEASKIIGKDSSPALVRALRTVSYSPLVTATIFSHAKDLGVNPKGLGVLMPRVEGRKCLGVLYNSSAFNNRVKNPDTVSLTMMLGGNHEILKKSDIEIGAIVVSELRELFGLTGDPLEIRIHRWSNAVPTYNKNLLETWTLAQESWCSTPGHILFGNYTGQVSLRGMLELASHLGK
jgi:oxygen-dependent protoporphyrinogen oxidase